MTENLKELIENTDKEINESALQVARTNVLLLRTLYLGQYDARADSWAIYMVLPWMGAVFLQKALHEEWIGLGAVAVVAAFCIATMLQTRRFVKKQRAHWKRSLESELEKTHGPEKAHLIIEWLAETPGDFDFATMIKNEKAQKAVTYNRSLN